jgi:Flp pilus assembly protein TadG
MRSTNGRRRKAQRGTQIIEFAFVLPILVFLVMSVSEGASLVRVHQVLNNAASEAARTAAAAENQNGWNGSQQNTVAAQAACSYLRSNSGAFVNWNAVQDATCSDPAFSIQVTRLSLANAPQVNGIALSASKAVVTYQYPLQLMPALPWLGIPNPLPLKGVVEFRNFY